MKMGNCVLWKRKLRNPNYPTMDPLFTSQRKLFHQQLMESVLTVDADGIPSIADRGQKFSKLGFDSVAAKIRPIQHGR